MLRNARHDALDQVAVRIDEHEPLASFDIGEDEPLEQGRFARPGFPDDVHVRQPIGLLDAKNSPVVSGIGASEIRDRGGIAIHATIFRATGGGHRRQRLASRGGAHVSTRDLKLYERLVGAHPMHPARRSTKRLRAGGTWNNRVSRSTKPIRS